MADTGSFWLQLLRKATDILENTSEDILGEHLKAQVEQKLEPLLKLLQSPEGRKAFDSAFAEAAARYQHKATSPSDREMRGEIIELLTRTIAGDVDEASRDVVQGYLLRSESSREQMDGWMHRHLAGTRFAKGERVYEKAEVTKSLDAFFEELNSAFWEHPFFAQRVSQAEIAALLRQILGRLPETLDIPRLQSNYLKYLQGRYAYLDLGGIAPKVNNRVVKLAMEEIYVPIISEREMDLRQTWLRLRSELLHQEPESYRHVAKHETGMDIAPEKMVDLVRALDEDDETQAWLRFREQFAGTTATQEVATIRDILAQPRSVLLGHPGTGKSTTLHYIAFSLAKGLTEHVGEAVQGRLPIIIRLVEYASARNKYGPGLRLRDYLRDIHDIDRSRLFAHELEHGNCLVLLDGLDEVIDPAQRAHVANEIEALVADYSENHYVITSRIVGYEAGRLTGDFTHFTIGAMHEEGIGDFIQQWYAAIEREAGREATVDVQERAEELSRAINSRPGIRRLATNPLLLTIIALVNWKGRALPHRRVEVYRHAAETLVESWPRRMRGVEFDVEEVLGLLAPVAYRIFSDRSSEGITESELLPLMTEAMVQIKPGMEVPEARAYVDDLLPQLSEHSGLFLERGFDALGTQAVYGFLHLAFAEYLAARHLADRWEGQKNEKARRALLAEYAHVPRWREVVLLMVAHIGLDGRRRVATEVLSDLLAIELPYEDKLHRNLILAGYCLADDLRPETYASDWVLQELLQLMVATPIYIMRVELEDLIWRMRGTCYEDVVKNKLLALHGNESQEVRDRVAIAIGSLGSHRCVEELLDVLGGENDLLRMAAGRALVKIGSEDVINGLLSMLDDEREDVRYFAAHTLGDIGSEDVVERLLSLLDDEREDVRNFAAHALGEIGSEDVVERLLSLLGDENEKVRSVAAYALGNVASERAEEELLSLLGDESEMVRWSAARALGEIGSERAVDALLELLGNDSEELWRVAILALRRSDNEKAVAGLLTLLNDERGQIRGRAATTLGEIASDRIRARLFLVGTGESSVMHSAITSFGGGYVNKQAVERLLCLLDDENLEVRRNAAMALSVMDKDVVLEPISTLLGDEDPAARYTAALALSAVANERASGELMGLLSDDDDTVRSVAAAAIGEIGSEPAIQPLLNLLDDSSEDVRSMAVRALGRIGSERAVKGLLGMLGDDSQKVRDVAAVALGQIGGERAVEGSLDILNSNDGELRRNAALALGWMGSDLALDSLIELLDDNEYVTTEWSPMMRASSPCNNLAYQAILAILEQQMADPGSHQSDSSARRVAGPWDKVRHSH